MQDATVLRFIPHNPTQFLGACAPYMDWGAQVGGVSYHLQSTGRMKTIYTKTIGTISATVHGAKKGKDFDDT